METSMEVDQHEEPPGDRVLVHPLAIVNMSDQYTRIRCGGSPLDSDAPVTGLLFGTRSKKAKAARPSKGTSSSSSSYEDVLEVRDAEDIPLDLSESAILQEELHRAVFPAHAVVGWYRVAETEDVLESDVILTDQLAQHYRKDGSSSSSSSGSAPFVFALLVIDGGLTSDVGKGQSDLEDEPLPLSVYRQADGGGGVLHSVPNWALETLDSERIAVERVIREQRPPPEAANDPGASADAAAAAAAETADAVTSLSLDGPRFVQHADTLEHSLSAIHRRLEVLRAFLQDTLDDKIPWNPSLVRQVNEVMLQAGAISRPGCSASQEDGSSAVGPISTGSTTVGGSSGDMVVPLAYLLKTVDAVRSYSDKFRAVHDSTAAAASTTATAASGAAGLASSFARSRDRDYSKRL